MRLQLSIKIPTPTPCPNKYETAEDSNYRSELPSHFHIFFRLVDRLVRPRWHASKSRRTWALLLRGQDRTCQLHGIKNGLYSFICGWGARCGPSIRVLPNCLGHRGRRPTDHVFLQRPHSFMILSAPCSVRLTVVESNSCEVYFQCRNLGLDQSAGIRI